MDIGSITSQLSKETGYSESDLNGLLSNRMEHYNKLTKRAAEVLAAAQLNKTVNTEEKIILPAVGCSLGNINIAKNLRRLADAEPDKYNTRVNEMLSGDVKKFVSALKDVTSETETTLRENISELDERGVARFIKNLHELTFTEDDGGVDTDAEFVPKTDLENLCMVMGKLTEFDEKKLAQAVKGIQIYV